MRIIETDADLREGIRALRRKCPHLRRVHDLAGDPPLRRHAPGFEGLARIVVGQQLSLASAEAIWRRFTLAVRPMSAAAISQARRGRAAPGRAVARQGAHAARRQRGRSSAGSTSRHLAHAPDDGRARGADRGARHRPVERRHLPAVLPRPRRRVRRRATSRCRRPPPTRCSLDARPSREELLAIAERWRPWRGVAAHLLWAYYKVAAARRANPKKA